MEFGRRNKIDCATWLDIEIISRLFWVGVVRKELRVMMVCVFCCWDCMIYLALITPNTQQSKESNSNDQDKTQTVSSRHIGMPTENK